MKKKILFVVLFILIICLIVITFCFRNNESSSNIESENNNVYLKIDLQKQEQDYYEYNYLIVGSNDKLFIKEKNWLSNCLQNIDDYVEIKIENNKIYITLIKDSSTRLMINFGVENNSCEKKIIVDWKQKWNGFNEYNTKIELNDIENKYYNKISDYEDKIAHEIGIYNLTELYTIPLEIDYEIKRNNINYKSFVCNNITKNVTYVDYNSSINANNKNIIKLFNNYFNNEEINNLDNYIKLDVKESWNDERIDYINKYFETYPKIKGFLDGQIEMAKEKGYVVTMFGRRRPVPELKSSNFMQRAFGERVAMNSPIQGTAADIIKIAMNRVYKRLTEEGLKSRLVLQVHDELLIETKVEEIEEVSRILEEEMKGAAALSVELDVDMHQGNNWYEAK